VSQSDLPPGWTYNPSRWSERLPVLVLALTGFGIAAYLGMYQWGAFPFVWEPFFGDGSHRILKESSLAHLLPVPDAVIGAVVYLLDATAGAIGGRARWRTLPWIVLLNGLIASGLGFGGMLLAIFQPVLFHAYCTLCLASAVCSIAMVGPVMAEVLVTLQFLKRERDRDRSLWRAVCGGRLVPELKEVLRAEPHPGNLNCSNADEVEPRRAVGFPVSANLVSVSLGSWLMAAPAVLGYGGTAAMDDRIAGPVAVACGLIALHEVTRSLLRVTVVVGGWLVVAPWLFGFGLPALLNSTAVGILLCCGALIGNGRRQGIGGGWASLAKGGLPSAG
jgi:hypothetical protein